MKPGSVLVASVLWLSPSIGQVQDPLFDEARVIHYPVQGTSLRELRRDLELKGPRDAAGKRVQGLTTWKIEWTFDVVETEGACEITRVQVDLTATVTLPQWTPGNGAPDALVDAWRRYETALRRHEARHYRHGVMATEQIRALADSASKGPCRTVGQAFDAKASRILQMHASLSQLYDVRTRHGATEGVVL